MSLPLFSLQSFYNFCNTRPASQAYPYHEHCAVMQYGMSLGIPDVYMDMRYVGKNGPKEEWETLARGYPRTFGALAARIRERIAIRAH